VDRRQFLLQASASVVGLLSTRCASSAPVGRDRRLQLERLMTRLHDQQLFTGELLVAEKGSVIYEGAFGAADRRTGRPYTTTNSAGVRWVDYSTMSRFLK
jgi:CubicO group peptidase (beta-lactamase class C family)